MADGESAVRAEATGLASAEAVLETMATAPLFPVVGVSHGPGPGYLLDEAEFDMFRGAGKTSKTVAALRGVLDGLPRRPEAIVIVTAHWMGEDVDGSYLDAEGRTVRRGSAASAVAVSSGERPELLFDYYGFPKEAYQLKYNAPGDPKLAKQIAEALDAEGVPVRLDATRGWDHGTFIPLSVLNPAADIPVVAVSIHPSGDPSLHLRIGAALAKFRSSCLVVASGSVTHNLRESIPAMRRGEPPAPAKWALEFEEWLCSVFARIGAAPRLPHAPLCAIVDLLLWADRAPGAKMAHPTPDHFVPFLAAAGAGNPDLVHEALRRVAARVAGDESGSEKPPSTSHDAMDASPAPADADADSKTPAWSSIGGVLHRGWAFGSLSTTHLVIV